MISVTLNNLIYLQQGKDWIEYSRLRFLGKQLMALQEGVRTHNKKKKHAQNASSKDGGGSFHNHLLSLEDEAFCQAQIAQFRQHFANKMIMKLRNIQPEQAFGYFNVSRTGYMTQPEFELGLDLLFSKILITFAKSTEKYKSLLSQQMARGQPQTRSQQRSPEEDYSALSKYLMYRIDYDQDGYLTLTDFTMIYTDDTLLNFNPHDMRRTYQANQGNFLQNLRFDFRTSLNQNFANDKKPSQNDLSDLTSPPIQHQMPQQKSTKTIPAMFRTPTNNSEVRVFMYNIIVPR